MFHLIEHLLIASNSFPQDWLMKKYFTGTTSTEVVKFGFICEKENIQTNLQQLFQSIHDIPVSEEMIFIQRSKVINEIQYRKKVDFFQYLDAGLDILFKNNTYSNCSGGDIQTVEDLEFDDIKAYWNILLRDAPFHLSMAGQLHREELMDFCDLCQQRYPEFFTYNLAELDMADPFSFKKVYISSDSHAALYFFQGPGKMDDKYVYLKLIETLLKQSIDSHFMVRTSLISYHAISFILLFVREF